jgi:hypothetical protein
LNADLLDGLDSTQFTLTSSFAAQTASFTAFTASQNILNGTYATTGSNTFKNPQTINSNLTVTGSITAATLVVQTITSSIVYSSGSNVFGNASSNTQTFTGSLSVSGSTHSIFGNVVVGNNSSINASAKLEVKGDLFLTPSSSIASIIHLYNKDSTNETYIYDSGSSSNSALTFAPGGTTRMTINSSGNVLIGTTTDSGFGKLQITGLVNINTSDSTAASTSQQAYDYSRLRIKATNGSNYGLSFGYSGGNYFYLQSCYNEGSTGPMMLNPFGGSVNIGTNTPDGSALRVVGNVSVAGAVGATSGFGMNGAGSNSIGDGIYLQYVNTATAAQCLLQLNASSGLDLWTYNTVTIWTKVGNFNQSSGVYTALSDVNKKKDFEASTIGLNAILGLKPTLYRMKSEDEILDKQLGFIAQEVKEFIPQAYIEQGDDDDKFIGLNYNAITATLVKALQEANAKITALEEKLERNNIN